MNDPSLPYVAQAPWYVRFLGLPAVAAMVISLWPTPTPVAFQVWEQSSWFFRCAMVLAAVVIPSGAAGLLFEKTLFTETGIEHRTKFLRRIAKSYAEIERLEYEARRLGRPESLEIIFSDRNKIFITGGQADLQVIFQILKIRTIKHVQQKRR